MIEGLYNPNNHFESIGWKIKIEDKDGWGVAESNDQIIM